MRSKGIFHRSSAAPRTSPFPRRPPPPNPPRDCRATSKATPSAASWPETARDRFGFLLDALAYGAPPHGGIALGLDRMVMLFAGLDNIRDVIAFPKTQKATDLMTEAPGTVDTRQLRDLAIKLDR